MGDLHQCLPSEFSPQGASGWRPELDRYPPSHRVTAEQEEGTSHSPCGIEGGQAPPASPNLVLSGQARHRPGVRCPDCKAPSAHQEQSNSRGHSLAGLGNRDDVLRTPRVRAQMGKLRPKKHREHRSQVSLMLVECLWDAQLPCQGQRRSVNRWVGRDDKTQPGSHWGM